MNQNTLKFILGLVLSLFLLIGIIFAYRYFTNDNKTNTASNITNVASENTTHSKNILPTNEDNSIVQPTEKTPPTLTGSNPKLNETVTTAPLWVVTTFSKEIHPSSTLRVVNNATKKDVGTDVTKFSSDKKSMTLNVNIASPGSYSVFYSICNMQKAECTSDQYTFTYSASSN